MKSKTVSFTQMKEGTAQDFRLIAANDLETAGELPDRLIQLLRWMAEDDGAYKISRLDHVLQTATRCERDGADDDWIVAALLHDLGDVIAPYGHDKVAAEIIRPFVREEVRWTVAHHGTFQMFYNKSLDDKKRMSREQYKDHPYYQATIDFCEKWDQCSFDPDYDTLPLEHFIPALKRVFSRPAFDPENSLSA